MAFLLNAQSVSGVQASIVDDQLEIKYRVTGLQSGQKFRVRLFSSIDSFAQPIDNGVAGDVGEDISLQTTNTITIADPIGTLGPITGDVNFRVRLDLIYFPVTVTSHSGFFTAKRGKKFVLGWTGGLTTDNVTINLYRNLNLIQENIYSSLNNGTAEFKMPKKLDLGDGYHMELAFPSLDARVSTPDFMIKRKQSIAARVLTYGIIAGGAAAILLSPTTPPPPGLPEPPDRPGDGEFSFFFFNR